MKNTKYRLDCLLFSFKVALQQLKTPAAIDETVEAIQKSSNAAYLEFKETVQTVNVQLFFGAHLFEVTFGAPKFTIDGKSIPGASSSWGVSEWRQIFSNLGYM